MMVEGTVVMNRNKELLLIAEELQIDFIKNMEAALLKIQAKRLGGKNAEAIISHSILYAWTLWLKQLTPQKRTLLFEDGCHLASEKILEMNKADVYGYDDFTKKQ